MIEEGQIVTAIVEAFSDTPHCARLLIAPRTRVILDPENLSWKRKRQKVVDYFDVGDEILVKVLSIKARAGRPPLIKVGFRETEPNPWPLIRSIHPEESFSICRIVGFLSYGVNVLLPSGFEALLHKKEISWEREMPRIENLFKLGQQLNVQIKSVFPEEEKIHVSLKDATPNPWKQFAEQKPELKPAVGIVSGIAP